MGTLTLQKSWKESWEVICGHNFVDARTYGPTAGTGPHRVLEMPPAATVDWRWHLIRLPKPTPPGLELQRTRSFLLWLHLLRCSAAPESTRIPPSSWIFEFWVLGSVPGPFLVAVELDLIFDRDLNLNLNVQTTSVYTIVVEPILSLGSKPVESYVSLLRIYISLLRRKNWEGLV